MKKTITIKDALIEDGEYLNSLKTDGLTVAGAFSKLVNLAKETKVNEVNQEDYQSLINEKESLQIVNQEQTDTITELIEANRALTLELEEKNAQMRLNANSFLIDLSPANAKKVRALRLLLKKQNKIPTESTEQEFTNRYVNQALDYLIRNKYDFLNKD